MSPCPGRLERTSLAACRRASSRAIIVTEQPKRLSSDARARPIPLLPPVIIACDPARDSCMDTSDDEHNEWVAPSSVGSKNRTARVSLRAGTQRALIPATMPRVAGTDAVSSTGRAASEPPPSAPGARL